MKPDIKKQRKFCGIMPMDELAKPAPNKPHVFRFYVPSYIYDEDTEKTEEVEENIKKDEEFDGKNKE